MTLHSDAAKTGTAAARHTWLDEAADKDLVAPATPHRISIFGLGYVGAVSLPCLARTPEVLAALQAHTRPEQLLLDVAVLPDREAHHARYRGVC